MSGISERDLFAGYGVPYDDPFIRGPRPRRLPDHVLTVLEIRQRIAAHHDRIAEERAAAIVRAERLVAS